MSPRDKSARTTDQQLARYLLGLVDDDEADRLDEASVSDDQVATRLRVVENDLVDAYVGGRLEGEMLKGFESHYLASPRRRENVAFARSFMRAVNQAAPGAAEKAEHSIPASAGDSVDASGAGSPAPRSKVASRLIATAALLLVACGILLSRGVWPRNGLNLEQKPAVAAAPRPSEPGQQSVDPRGADDVAAKEQERRDSSMVALVLLPQTRAAVDRIPTLPIEAGIDRVTLDLRLDSNDFPRYQVALIDPVSNQTVWRSGPVTATSPDRTPTVSVIVPARVLKPQHYSLALMARTGRDASVVGSYTFQVVRR